MPKDTLESAITNLNELQELDAEAVKKDIEFKSLFKFKSVAAMLLKYAAPDFAKYSVREIAESIVDITPREPKSEAERLHSEIDLQNTENSGIGEKLIIMDILFTLQFEVRLPDSEQIYYVNMTTDFEMQHKKPEDYSLVTRGVYYGASMLRDTLKSKEKYEKIHKVYSIWLCNFKLLDESDKLDRYVHRYNIIRNYNESGAYIYEKDINADLMEIVFIELGKLGVHASEHRQDELAEFLDTVFNDISKLPRLIEEKSGIAIEGTALKEGVNEVIDKSTYGEIMRVNGERKAKVKIAENMIMMGIGYDTIKKATGLSEKEIEKIAAELKKQEQK